MKTCPSCGAVCNDNETFCGNCGASLNAGPAPQYSAYQNPPQSGYGDPNAYSPYGAAPGYRNSYAAPRAATMKEFLKLPEGKSLGGGLTAIAIICFVFAGFNLFVGFALDTFPYSLIDVAVLAGCGLAILLLQSRVGAIVLLAYALFGTIYTLVQSGAFTGWLIIILGIFAVITTFKAHSLWAQYQQQA